MLAIYIWLFRELCRRHTVTVSKKFEWRIQNKHFLSSCHNFSCAVVGFKINNKKWVEKQNPTVLLSMNDIKCWRELQGESVLLTVMHYVHLVVI